MQLKSNIDEVISRLQKLSEKAETFDFSDALVVGVNAAMAAMKFRVFNTGRDIKNTPFGKYKGNRSRVTNRKYRILKYGDTEESARDKKKKLKNLKDADDLTEYEKLRVAHGRQVTYKDLEFTGGLRRGIILVKENDRKVVVAIPNAKLFKIAEYQTQQISKILGQQVVIFGMSDEERELLKTNTNQALSEIYGRLFNS